MDKRIRKVEELLKQLISELTKENVPEELGLVTITDTIITPDLQKAKIYVSVLESENAPKVFDLLEKNKLGFQHQLGRQLKMRYTPKLEFVLDESQQEINHVEEILKGIEKDA